MTQSLIARGWDVVALVRNPDSPQARALTRMGVQCVAGDVTDRESMLTELNSKLTSLYTTLQEADAAPTQAMVDAAADLRRQVTEALGSRPPN